MYFSILLVVFSAVNLVSGQNCSAWDYESLGAGSYTNGPQVWLQTCPTCLGNQQSPIDLNTNTASSPAQTSPMYTGVQLTPNASWTSVNFTLLNTGDVMRLLFNNLQISVTGLGLNGTFYVAQMHWHWGSNSSCGSEHTLAGQQFAMEGHLVVYNSIYSSFTAATGQPNGVAVLAVWYNVSGASVGDNPNFAPIINALPSIPLSGQTVNMAGFNLYNLMPVTAFPYFRYMGSLTTPACNQNVTWSVINNVFYLSANQMNIIRNSMFFGPATVNVSMVNNFRPTQALNGRTVYYVTATPFQSSNSQPISSKPCFLLLSLSLVFVTVAKRLVTKQ